MDDREVCTGCLAKIMDLGMAIVARSNAVIGLCCQNLVELDLAILTTFFSIPGLEKPSASAAAKVVGLVGPHFDEIFFPNKALDHVTQIVCHWIPETFTHDLTRILNRELDLSFLIPVGVDLELSFSNPLGIILVDAGNLKVIRNIEFFQSFQD